MTEETIFLTALEQATPAERAAYLDAACAGDPALRERVEALLRSQADPDSFLDVPAIARQAEGTDEPLRTTDLPANGEKEPKRRQAETTMRKAVLALLAPGKEPNSLGRLDHYEMLEVVGEGGMGIVFKARDTKLQRIVAIKVLAPHLAANATARARFIREAQSGAAVRDDHVVGIHAVSDEESVPYLAMEFIGGVTLEQRIKRSGPMRLKEILRIGMQTAEGLAAAHRQGLIHRDVKPANILLENGVERVKITDFGLARAIDDPGLTQPGMIAGTPLFMSPEQARGEILDQRSDLFSLGSVLYTLCTGQPAFAAGNTLAVLKRVCEETPRPIREINPDIPEWLAAIVSKLLAKEKGERFQSAVELAELLGQHLAQIQQPSLVPPQPTGGKEALPPATSQAGPGRPAARKRKRLFVAAVLLGLVAVAASLVTVAVLSWAWLFPSPGDNRSEDSMIGPKDEALTVSKNPKDGGRFRTIQEALENVEPGMTIRVLDDAVYEEHLLINSPEQHRGVVLEATGKATIRRPSGKTEAVWIDGVPGFTLRGFRFATLPDKNPHSQVFIGGACPGVVLDRLDMTTGGRDCVNLCDVPLSGKDAPIVIQNCTMRGGHGVVIEGRDRDNLDRPLPSGHVVIRDNTMVRCGIGVELNGEIHKVHLVGNRILNSRYTAISLEDLLPGTADILVANNTLLRSAAALRVRDDHSKGMDFLKCKNIRFHNNLVLVPEQEVDLWFLDHPRGNDDEMRSGRLEALLNSPQWRFSHNWREIDPEKAAARSPDCWIPARPNDHLQVSIKVLSRKPGDPNFLRPPKDSPLAWSGAGGETIPASRIASAVGQASALINPWPAAWAVAQTMNQPDRSLPAYVGAVPPEGVEPWDWQKTWKTLAR